VAVRTEDVNHADAFLLRYTMTFLRSHLYMDVVLLSIENARTYRYQSRFEAETNDEAARESRERDQHSQGYQSPQHYCLRGLLRTFTCLYLYDSSIPLQFALERLVP